MGAIVPAESPSGFGSNRSSAIRDHFPFPSVRVPQELALQRIEEAVREGKKYIVLEIPTGGGKSGIAISAGSWAKTMARDGGYEPGAISPPRRSPSRSSTCVSSPPGAGAAQGYVQLHV